MWENCHDKIEYDRILQTYELEVRSSAGTITETENVREIDMTISRQPISNTKDWCTPPEYVMSVRCVMGTIELDPCSNPYSMVKAEKEYMLPEHDGLKETWDSKTIYVNPPYGRDKARGTTIKDWLWKCTEANQSYNSRVMALIPVATNTKHWQDNIFLHAKNICFLRVPRLKFYLDGKEYKKGAPMSCAMVYWFPESYREACSAQFRYAFDYLGKVIDI
jgi:hypothetical protein